MTAFDLINDTKRKTLYLLQDTIGEYAHNHLPKYIHPEIDECKSSSLSCRAARTDIPDPLSSSVLRAWFV